MEAVKSQTT
ncbi:hypothetical protein AOLI_G00090360 [Acnodon oligacanthus]